MPFQSRINSNSCSKCPVMVWCSIQGDFPPRAYCSWDPVWTPSQGYIFKAYLILIVIQGRYNIQILPCPWRFQALLLWWYPGKRQWCWEWWQTTTGGKGTRRLGNSAPLCTRGSLLWGQHGCPRVQRKATQQKIHKTSLYQQESKHTATEKRTLCKKNNEIKSMPVHITLEKSIIYNCLWGREAWFSLHGRSTMGKKNFSHFQNTMFPMV